ncbi:MAG: glycosyltransferase [Candidatus Tenebribacter mawsonii]|nr:glycosyltransferase [Candidatus Tenebribacter mawsonii]
MIFRIIENLLIIYYLSYFVIDWLFFVVFLINIRKEKITISTDDEFNKHSVSIIVPAYNEEITILDSIKMLLSLDYPNYEVIVVNDSSTDKTMQKLLNNFDLREFNITNCNTLTTKSVNKCYKLKDSSLKVIDKSNGGKADSINVGINLASNKFICTIDADSILDKTALKQTVQPFIDDPDLFVSGGQLAVANGVVIKNNHVYSSKLPSNIWVQWQIVEYMKSFLISRFSLSKMNAIVIMSGAFSLYKRKDLLAVGGFLTAHNQAEYIENSIGLGKQTVCEDMEIVVRLWRYFIDKKQTVKARFLPHPLCWTEVPDNSNFLLRQRNRWHRGLAETLIIHKDMIFEPEFKRIGTFALPYFLLFELLAPIIKLFTLFFIITAIILGSINQQWLLLTLLFTTIVSTLITSLGSVIIEQWSIKKQLPSQDALRYKTTNDWLRLILMSVLGDFIYVPFRIYAQLIGLKDFINKKNEWYKFDRTGFNQTEGK